MPTGDNNKNQLTPEQQAEIKLDNAYDRLSDGSIVTLKLGSTGSRVKALQTIIGIAETGTFGNITQNALIDWQEKNGLSKTGQFDTASRFKILELSLDRTINKVSPFSTNLEDTLTADIPGLNTQFGPAQSVEPEISPIEDFSTRLGITSPSPILASSAESVQPISNIQTTNIAEGLAESPTETKSPTKPLAQVSTAIEPVFDMLSFEKLLGIGSSGKNVDPIQMPEVNAAQIAAANNSFITAQTISTTNSKVISDVDSALYNNYIQAVNSQNSVADQINNINNLTNPQTVNQITNNSSQLQQTVENLEPIAAVMNSDEQLTRVETNELISLDTVNQIIKPANPVVSSVEMMSSQVANSIQNLGADLSSTVSNLKSGDQVNSSNVTQVDQSSIYNMQTGQPTAQMNPSLITETRPETPTNNLNHVMLSAIYELLASGIKVKIVY
jgi:hypothetical protein